MALKGKVRKKLVVAGTILLMASGTAYGSGWRIPEQSVNATARSAGYVAYTPGPDAAYYNPANMSWLEDSWLVAGNLTGIYLTAIDYTDNRSPLYDGSSQKERFLLPTIFAVSPFYGNWRFGFSLVAPGGLSKRWQDPYPKTYSENFSLKIFEANPTVSYKFCDQFSVGFGLRGVYLDGKVSSRGMLADGTTISRDMEGDTLEGGINLAVTARPLDNLNLALTYRSNVNFDVEGNADLATSLGQGVYSGEAGVTIPLPAVLAISAAYTFFDQLTVELAYDRTYWSEYESLDFNYSTPLSNPVLYAAFDLPLAKQWSDTNAFRISAEYALKNGLTLMAGFAIDENPAPSENVGFELPDSDALLYSVGVKYLITEHMELGMSYLFDEKESRNISNGALEGTLDNAAAHLLTIGLTWKL